MPSVRKVPPIKKAAAPAKRAPRKVAFKAEVQAELAKIAAEKVAPVRRSPGRPAALKLNKGSKAHQGVFDRKENVAYCRVVLEPSYGHSVGSAFDIKGYDEFIAWLNKKGAKHLGEDRFVKIEVVGADFDQRTNSGINLLYKEFLDDNEDIRVASTIAMLAQEYAFPSISRQSSGQWILSGGHHDSPTSGGWHVGNIADRARISNVKARQALVEFLLAEVGQEMFDKLNLVTEEWAVERDERLAALAKDGVGVKIPGHILGA